MCNTAGIDVKEMRGLAPDALSLGFWKLLLTRRVPEDFSFRYTRSLATGYIGYGVKPVSR